MPDDKAFMSFALEEAHAALEHDDVPIGCVIARGDEVLAHAHNARERDGDPTAHAEILALRAASKAVGSWRLDACTVYVTLEPCVMCAGAIVLARAERLVYGATDPKAGAIRSLYNIADDPRLNHRVSVTPGVLEREAGDLLRAYFSAKRA
ncbi:MAG: nucleoside deaminase [Actinobacteria bacterium]|nr:MAG: nucleoside deaminase [Actinomycetota bacterium]